MNQKTITNVFVPWGDKWFGYVLRYTESNRIALQIYEGHGKSESALIIRRIKPTYYFSRMERAKAKISKVCNNLGVEINDR
jgi:uncharacterized protein (DUF486 family)